jgi:hypothetical protein
LIDGENEQIKKATINKIKRRKKMKKLSITGSLHPYKNWSLKKIKDIKGMP